MNTKADSLVEILLAEDNPGDADLVIEAFEESKIQNRVHVVEDGEEALDFLYQRGTQKAAPKPGLILLDLNLPKKNGQEILAEVKKDPTLRNIPVVILTSSAADKDILGSYNLNANAYVTKPFDVEDLFRVVQAIGHFWIRVVSLPQTH